ncbi:lipopolysaccharide biosynthesis protein BplA [Vibrio sp.]|uniref:lipopolysaccharide biosynthesis protein BplA n=1 Tax=Vibrio sp. TaxID=678 RepID=UPI00378A9415
MDYQNKQAARASFTDILETKPSLEPLADSQVMQGVNIFQGLALEYALGKLERARQEGYSSTALNRGSILALAEGKQYIPRKPLPSRGPISISNKSEYPSGLPAHFPLVSEDQVHYMLVDAVAIDSHSTAAIDVIQVEEHSLYFTVEQEKPFIEFLFGREISRQTHQFNVFVDQGEGYYKEWKKAPRFRNVEGNDAVFDEFYSHTDQIGIRFGNNIFGLVPKANSKVKVDLWLTKADIKLMPKQPLTPLDPERADEQLEFVTTGVLMGGTPAESTEEIKINSLYYELYDDNNVLDDDYSFFIKRHYPGVIWCKVWGEAEQEEMEGRMDDQWVNRVFVALYAPNDPDIVPKVEETLKTVIPQLNRRYSIMPPEEVNFVAKIEGKIKRDVMLSDARKAITQVLIDNYHRDAVNRKDKALKRDLYCSMNNLNIFASEDDIYIELTGTTEPQNLKQIVSIDLDASLAFLNLPTSITY